jgi:hypothetical protein
VTKFSTSTAREESLSGYLRRMRQIILDSRLWADKRSELGLFLQRSFWKPLRNTAEIFHVLPLAAVVVLFVVLATDGQLREIYISYLEYPSDGAASASIRIVAGLITIALLSAVLFEAHNALSTMRINVVFSSHSDPAAHYKLRRLQRAAAFVLAFMPWLGVTIGLFGARNFVAARYCKLFKDAHVDQATLDTMHPLLQVNSTQVAAGLIVLGAAAAFFASNDERNRLAHYAVAGIAPVLAVLLFLLFTDRLDPNAWALLPLWMYVAVAATTLGYFLIYHRLYHQRGGFWLWRLFIRTGIGFRKRRQRRLALWAFLPWFGLAIYFLFFGNFVAGGAASGSCPGQALAAAESNSGRWAIFPVAMCLLIAIGLLLGHSLLRFNPNKRRPLVIITVCGLAFLAALLSVYNDPDLIVRVYRFIGPLATLSLELLFLIATFAVLAVLSQNSGFPALTLIVLTIVVCVMFPNYAVWTAGALGLAYFAFAVVSFVSGRFVTGFVMLLLIGIGIINLRQITQGASVGQNPEKTSATASSGKNAPTARTAYMCWLDQKGIPATRTAEQESLCGSRPKHLPAVNKPYRAFIVAAEGGGIYAASAVAAFLAQLEDDQSGFARHIFAISGVSGGSIGATVFHALDHARQPDAHGAPGAVLDDASTKGKPVFSSGDRERCTQQAGTKVAPDLSTSVASIMQDDHLSPVVGSIFPEIFDAPLKRPDALRASFEYSAAKQDAGAGRHLCAPFVEHWSAAAPALVLNSTWVEMGLRVAFAPFRLHDLDESLYSFRDPGMPDEECRDEAQPASCISLMTAAGVSARFPGMMPPFSVRLPHDKRWNFVDGGYSDNSGSTTALDIYRVLKPVYPDEVELRVILITSSRTQPNLADQSVNGTVFLDTLAPINAILKVREGLANDAVGRACSEIYRDPVHPEIQSQGCIEHAGVKDGMLQIVEIQDQTYGLPLGWKISQTSFAVIRWMLGKENLCPAVKETETVSEDGTTPGQAPVENNDTNAQLRDDILRRNSRVSRLLLDLVRADPVPGKALP